MTRHTIEWIRIVILGAGVVSAWVALTAQSFTFYVAYRTFWHESTSVATNPFLTPCLYGALAFLGAFFWASILHLFPNPRSEMWLKRLLIFGIVFAGVVVAYDCADYFHLFSFGVPIVCNPNANPLATACFRGLIFFIVAYVTSVWLKGKPLPQRPEPEATIS